MHLIILGSGTGIPLINRASSSLAMRQGKTIALFDMGPDTMHQLVRAGLDFKELRNIFITHFHPDHTSGLIPFFFATRSPRIAKSRSPFTITGPEGLSKMLNHLRDAFSGALDLPEGMIEIEELHPEGIRDHHYQDFKVKVSRTRHTEESIAYRVEDKEGKSFVYSGDAAFCDELVNLATGTDLLIAECSFPDQMEMKEHLTPSLAGKIASLAGAKRLVLTHFYPEVLKSDIASQCRKTYGGELTLSYDLLDIYF